MNKKLHCYSCFQRYGYDFDEIHVWMDEPFIRLGELHRQERHNENTTPYEAKKLFFDIVPEPYRKFIEDAVRDHIILDVLFTSIKYDFPVRAIIRQCERSGNWKPFQEQQKKYHPAFKE